MRPPPHPASVIATVLLLGLLLHDASLQIAVNPAVGCTAWLVGGTLVLDYLVRLAWSPSPRRRAGRWRWAALPIAAVIVASTWWHPWPLRLRFAHSRAAFDQALAEVQAGGTLDRPRRVGTFHVEYVSLEGSAVCFVTGQGLADPVAICFDPTRREEFWLGRSLGGGWFACEL